MRLTCPSCDAVAELQDSAASRRTVRCPHCAEKIDVAEAFAVATHPVFDLEDPPAGCAFRQEEDGFEVSADPLEPLRDVLIDWGVCVVVLPLLTWQMTSDPLLGLLVACLLSVLAIVVRLARGPQRVGVSASRGKAVVFRQTARSRKGGDLDWDAAVAVGEEYDPDPSNTWRSGWVVIVDGPKSAGLPVLRSGAKRRFMVDALRQMLRCGVGKTVSQRAANGPPGADPFGPRSPALNPPKHTSLRREMHRMVVKGSLPVFVKLEFLLLLAAVGALVGCVIFAVVGARSSEWAVVCGVVVLSLLSMGRLFFQPDLVVAHRAGLRVRKGFAVGPRSQHVCTPWESVSAIHETAGGLLWPAQVRITLADGKAIRFGGRLSHLQRVFIVDVLTAVRAEYLGERGDKTPLS